MSEEVSDTKWTLLEVDTKAGKIVHQVDVSGAAPVHIAGGSIWLAGIKTNDNGEHCNITRFDASTLADRRRSSSRADIPDRRSYPMDRLSGSSMSRSTMWARTTRV